MNPALKKSVVAGLKAVPFLGDSVALLDVGCALVESSPHFPWKALQAAVATAASSTIIGGFFLDGFHHPAAAAAAFTAGVGAHLLAGAAEFAPQKIQAPFARAVDRAIDSFLPIREIDSR